jgi:hypothetical protein
MYLAKANDQDGIDWHDGSRLPGEVFDHCFPQFITVRADSSRHQPTSPQILTASRRKPEGEKSSSVSRPAVMVTLKNLVF